MSSFSVRPFEPGDEQGILDLFNRVFAEGNPAFVPRTMATWRRIYSENPAGVQIFVGLDADRRIVANYSSQPAPAVVRGRRRLCTQAVDSCVDRAFRGSLRKQSLFVTIATEFIRHYSTPGRVPFDDYMYGFPNEQAFPVGTRIVGYKPVLVPLPQLVREPEPAWLEGLEREAGGAQVEEIAANGPGPLPALFETHLAEWPLGVWRDAAWLQWRYAPRPDGLSYGALLARRAGQAVAAVVYRLGWMGQPIVPLVDWIGSGQDRAALAALLAEVGRRTRAAGGTRLVTWATPAMPHAATLAALGLRAEPSPFNLCIMTFAPECELEWARANWCLTMGDSDIY
jgi:Acetyltransferase (GNAT) domain